jgi:hypothetical protein
MYSYGRFNILELTHRITTPAVGRSVTKWAELTVVSCLLAHVLRSRPDTIAVLLHAVLLHPHG